MKRILHITSSLARNGTETFIMNVLRNIDRDRIMFDFLVYNRTDTGYESEALQLGSKIFSYTPRRKGVGKEIRSLNEFFRENAGKYDAVHFSGNSFTDIMPVKIAKKYGIPIRVFHVHSFSTRGIHNKLLHYLNRQLLPSIGTHYLACSEKARQWGYGHSGAYDRSLVVPNGIELERFKYDPEVRMQLRKELGIDDRIVIGHVGNFLPVKNHPFMLKIMRELRKTMPSALLMLVGDSPGREEIENAVRQTGMEKDVLFLGIRQDVNRFLSTMDIFLFPSNFEGLGIAAIEAQAAGLPVIASENVPRETGVTPLIEYMDLDSGPEAWASRIMELSRNLPSREYRESLNAYDIATTCRILETIYGA